jgi:hypothetical protein
LVLTLNFTFVRGVAKRLRLFVLLQMCKRLLATLGKIVTGCQRVLATLWQIFNRVSEGIGNPLQMQQMHTFVGRLPIYLGSDPLPEGIDYPLKQLAELDKPLRHLQEGCLIYKVRGNLFAIPLKKVKMKIQEATERFKKYQKFIFILGFIH